MNHLLWIEPNNNIARTLEQVLAEAGVDVLFTRVSSIEEAERSDLSTIDALILDPLLLSDVDALHFQTTFASLKKLFFTSSSSDTFIPLAQHFDVHHVILKELPFDKERFLFQLKRCLFPTDYEDFLGYEADASLETRMTLKNSNDITTALATVESLAENVLALESRMELCTPLLEAITNAVYHAPKKPCSRDDKYEKGQHIEALLPEEYMHIIVRQNEHVFGVSIVDQQGSLLASDILNSIAKNYTETGLFDESGRGFFLMHTLMDDLQITINPGVSCNILMIKHINPYRNPFDAFSDDATSQWGEPKPLFVNVL